MAVVNENDAVADEEIRFGDNDRLAALVANLVAASHLVLLTDTEGLLTADPRLDDSATLIEEVGAIDADLVGLAGASRSGVGSGGMASKLAAARMATWSGVDHRDRPGAGAASAERRARGRAWLGTTFHARSARLSARKAWIAFALASRGVITVNDGARRALEHDGRSLLRVGVVARRGDFVEGDALEIVGPDGTVVAQGTRARGRRGVRRRRRRRRAPRRPGAPSLDLRRLRYACRVDESAMRAQGAAVRAAASVLAQAT